MSDDFERVVYRTSVSTDKANSSCFLFDNPDEGREFVDQRLNVADADHEIDAWRKDGDDWLAFTRDGWIVGAVSTVTIHSEAGQALRAREEIYD